MNRLRQHRLHPQIKVLKEHWTFPTPIERDRLRLPFRRSIFVREVEIGDETGPFMFARTVIPSSTLTGRGRCLTRLGTRSLGSVLFANPKFERSAFEVKSCQLLPYSSERVWERWSLFERGGKSLLLREVFLPRLINWIHSL